MLGNWGIDWIEFRFPVDYEACDPNPELWDSVTVVEPGSGLATELHRMSVRISNAQVQVKLDSLRRMVTLSFNPSRAAGLEVPYLLPPSNLTTVCGFVIEQIPGIAPDLYAPKVNRPEHWHERWATDVTIVRLDMARDFIVPNNMVRTLQEKLPGVDPARGTIHKSRGGGWTLEYQTKSVGKDMLYNKSAQLGEVDSDDTVFRFETQYRDQRLKRGGLGTLAQVKDASVLCALRKQWKRRKFGTPIHLPVPRSEIYSQVPVGGRKEMDSFLAGSAEGDTSLFSQRMGADLRRQAKALGLNPKIPLSQQTPRIGQLDLESGEWVETTHPMSRRTG